MTPTSVVRRAALALLLIGLLQSPANAEERLPPATDARPTCPTEAMAGATAHSPLAQLHVATGYWLPIQPFLQDLGYPTLDQLVSPEVKTEQRVKQGRVQLTMPWQMSFAADGWQPPRTSACAHEESDCQVKGKDTAEEELTETEREILEIREKLGSLLDGTEFQQAPTVDDKTQLLSVLRALQAERPQPTWRPTRDNAPAPQPGTQTPSRRSRTNTLRAIAQQLDLAANDLEQQDLYQRADQLRELATELRFDAREERQAEQQNTPPRTAHRHQEPSRLVPDRAIPLGRNSVPPSSMFHPHRPAPEPSPPAEADWELEKNVEKWTGFRRLKYGEIAALRKELRRLQHILEPSATTPVEAYIEALSELGMTDLAESFRRSQPGSLNPEEIARMHSHLLRTQLRLVKDALDSIETTRR